MKKRYFIEGKWWVSLEDVERETIPRPDPEEARTAVDRYTAAVIVDVMSCEQIGPCMQIRTLRAALLKLMGVSDE